MERRQGDGGLDLDFARIDAEAVALLKDAKNLEAARAK